MHADDDRPTRTRRLQRGLALAAAALTAATMSVAAAPAAAADPSANAWLQLRICESGNRYTVDSGNGFYGAYQFSLGTWASVGGTGKPSDAKPAEQDYRALMLYRKRGWSPWTCAAMIGLHEDVDAKSGVLPPEPASFDTPYVFAGAGAESAATPAPAPGAAAWPGRQFVAGDFADEIAAWQRQATALGYPIIATGYVGPSTVAAIRAIQAKEGLPVNGMLGAQTWNAAWTLASGTAPGAAAAGVAAPSQGPAGGTDPTIVYKPQTRAQCGVGVGLAAPKAPAKPLVYNQTSREMQCFQWQLAARGAGLSGTAFYGSVTLGYVTTLQQQNGITGELDSNGRPAVGPKTWAAAWSGTFTVPKSATPAVPVG